MAGLSAAPRLPYHRANLETPLFVKAIYARLFAVLISGTLGLAPFSCCCARVESQQLEAQAHQAHMAVHMDGAPVAASPDHGFAPNTTPDGGHHCPHKITASLDSQKAPVSFTAVAPVPVAYHVTAATAFSKAPTRTEPSLRIKPPPRQTVTLISQHVLLLA